MAVKARHDGVTWIHELKTWPEHYQAVKRGAKKAEFRKDDREPRFEVGHVLDLLEYEPADDAFTGDATMLYVSHVARGGVIPEGWAMLSLTNDVREAPVGNLEKPQ